MNPTEKELTELENQIKQRTDQIRFLNDQRPRPTMAILDLNLENHRDKVKLKKLKKEDEIDE